MQNIVNQGVTGKILSINELAGAGDGEVKKAPAVAEAFSHLIQ